MLVGLHIPFGPAQQETPALFLDSQDSDRMLPAIWERPRNIGIAGIEPTTSWSQIRRPAKLGYIPKNISN